MPGIQRSGRQGAGSLVVTGARAFVMDDDALFAVRSGEVKYATRTNDGIGQASPPIFKGKPKRDFRFQAGQKVL